VKLLFLLRSLQYGGTERQAVQLAKGLARSGHDVKIAVFYPGGTLESEIPGISVLTPGKRGRWDVLGFAARLASLIRRDRPDVLHTFAPVPNLFAALVRPALPRTSIVVWGVRSADLRPIEMTRVLRLCYQAEGPVSRLADLIITNSHAGARAAAERGVDQRRIAVVPNGVDVDLYRPDASARRRVRAEWGVGDGQRLIGLVGRLDPVKDHPAFLRAAAIMARARDDVRFVCVGDGPGAYWDDLRALQAQLGLGGRLIWAGARNDMPSVYPALDLCCSTSLSEGFSNSIVEAMSTGVPCVVTDVGDSAHIVGDVGRVVPAAAPDRLAAACLEMLDLLAGSSCDLPARARARITQDFGTDALVTRTVALLQRALDERLVAHAAAGRGRPKRNGAATDS
jgi:glycosyltransferase involved in cell wall biosynthesis